MCELHEGRIVGILCDVVSNVATDEKEESFVLVVDNLVRGSKKTS